MNHHIKEKLMREIFRENVIKPLVAELLSTQKVPGKIDHRRLRRQLRNMKRRGQSQDNAPAK